MEQEFKNIITLSSYSYPWDNNRKDKKLPDLLSGYQIEDLQYDTLDARLLYKLDEARKILFVHLNFTGFNPGKLGSWRACFSKTPGYDAFNTHKDKIFNKVINVIQNNIDYFNKIDLTASGHSMGGALAQFFIVEYESRLQCLSTLRSALSNRLDNVEHQITLLVQNSAGIPKEECEQYKKLIDNSMNTEESNSIVMRSFYFAKGSSDLVQNIGYHLTHESIRTTVYEFSRPYIKFIDGYDKKWQWLLLISLVSLISTLFFAANCALIISASIIFIVIIPSIANHLYSPEKFENKHKYQLHQDLDKESIKQSTKSISTFDDINRTVNFHSKFLTKSLSFIASSKDKVVSLHSKFSYNS